MLKRWKTRSSRIVLQNPWWTYKKDEFEIPGGLQGEYNYVHTNGSSMVIPVMENGKILMVNQYRYLCEKESIEFPCGGVKEGKTNKEMALLELEEETGYRAEELYHIGEFNPFNGVTDEMCQLYIARTLRKTEQRPDATEEFEILSVTSEEIDDLISSNKIWDGMTLAAWSLAKLKHEVSR